MHSGLGTDDDVRATAFANLVAGLRTVAEPCPAEVRPARCMNLLISALSLQAMQDFVGSRRGALAVSTGSESASRRASAVDSAGYGTKHR
jgi:hypothetical protein